MSEESDNPYQPPTIASDTDLPKSKSAQEAHPLNTAFLGVLILILGFSARLFFQVSDDWFSSPDDFILSVIGFGLIGLGLWQWKQTKTPDRDHR